MTKDNQKQYNNHPFNFIMAGRLVDFKDYEFALDAFSIFNKKYSINFNVQIYGNGPNLKKLEKITNLYNLNDRVIFKPFHKDILSQFLNSDIFFMTSKVEGMSNSLGEAMSCGLACITLNFPSAKDLLNFEDPLTRQQIVIERNEVLFADRIYDFVMNKEKLLQIKKMNLERIQNKFSANSFLMSFSNSFMQKNKNNEYFSNSKEELIYFLFSHIQPGGGAEKQVLIQAQSLIEAGYNIKFLCRSIDKEHFNKYCPSGTYSKSVIKNLLFSKKYTLFSFLTYDVKYGILFSLIKKIRWIPFERIHPDYYILYSSKLKLIRKIKFYFLKFIYLFFAQTIFVQTESAKEAWEKIFKKSKKNIYVLFNIYKVKSF